MKERLKSLKQVFHGTTTLYKWDFRDIDLSKSRKLLDFGPGFYTTSNYTQAINWANYVNDKMKRLTGNNTIKPIVITYDIDIETLLKYNGRVFNKPDCNWAEFIYNNRVEDGSMISNFCNKNLLFDYVFGSYADGKRLANAIEGFKRKEFDLYKFCQIITMGNNILEDQLSFHTVRALRCLKLSNM